MLTIRIKKYRTYFKGIFKLDNDDMMTVTLTASGMLESIRVHMKHRGMEFLKDNSVTDVVSMVMDEINRHHVDKIQDTK